MSQPRYANPRPTSEVMERLAVATSHPSHAFWPADITLLDQGVADRTRIHGPRQVTDVYLLALAVKHGGCLATLDGTITVSAVRGAAQRHLVAI